MTGGNYYILIFFTFLVVLIQTTGATYEHENENNNEQKDDNTVWGSIDKLEKKDLEVSADQNDAEFFLPYKKLPDFNGPLENKDISIVPDGAPYAHEDTTKYKAVDVTTYNAYTEYKPPTVAPTEHYNTERYGDDAIVNIDEALQKSKMVNLGKEDKEVTKDADNEVNDNSNEKEKFKHFVEGEFPFNSGKEDKEVTKDADNEINENSNEKEKFKHFVEGNKTIENIKPVENENEQELFDNFVKDESKYAGFPTKPADTRRMFEHPSEPDDAKIAEIAREINFRKSHGLKPGTHGDSCKSKPIVCENQKYRSFDGTCNNLKKPLLGSKNSPYSRFLAQDYGPNFLPRGVTKYSKTNGYESALPSPRKISDTIMREGIQDETESKHNTHMLMQWGQFVDHDIISTSRDAFDCCDPEIKNLPRCFPISVPDTDQFFSQFSKTCLDFTRSDTHCAGGESWPEQFNKQTAFLDGSVVYGCHEKRAIKLRGGSRRKGGRLLGNSQLPHFLPSNFDVKMRTSSSDKPTDFVAGDVRVETQASLTSIQNLFFNEHNRIADELFIALKEKVSDEKELDEVVYQETRRILTAEIQHITYTEFLPNVLGKPGMSAHNLDHTICTYDENTDPSIFNSFATAAFRFGHSLVQSIFRGVTQPWRLGKFYSDSRFAFKDKGHGYVNELEGLSEQPCMAVDLHVSEQLTQQLFCNNKTVPGSGHDLVSINIQRGRDHGIPSYNSARKHCGNTGIESLQSRPADIGEEEWASLVSVYDDVEQIDLYVGGLAEIPAQGGLVGPTFSCIIGTMFKHLMDGDRYYYRHTEGQDIHPLTGAMLEEIQHRSLADIICENTDIQNITRNVFVQPGPDNPKVPCKEHRKMDLKSIGEQLRSEI